VALRTRLSPALPLTRSSVQLVSLTLMGSSYVSIGSGVRKLSSKDLPDTARSHSSFPFPEGNRPKMLQAHSSHAPGLQIWGYLPILLSESP